MRALLLLCLALLARPALAWSDLGHRAVADLAWKDLSHRARHQLRGLLRAHGALGTPECPVRSLADAAVWPDCIRHDPARFAYSFAWHYTDTEICGAYDPASAAACPPGKSCVTAQIPAQAAILADAARPASDRLRALAFLAHFVGDVHQPLHVGENHDQGGNKVALASPLIAGPKANLHALWDGPLATHALGDERGAARRLRATYPRALRAAWGRDPAAVWARESWELSRQFVYPDLGRGDVCTVAWPPEAPVAVDYGYAAAAAPLVRERIAKAGARLAAVIEGAVGGDQ